MKTGDLFEADCGTPEHAAHDYAHNKFSQGRESNESGQFVERCILHLAERRNYRIIDNHRSPNVQGDLLDDANARLMVRNASYRNLIGNKSHTEFLIIAYGRTIRIDCKGQNESGSTWQKVGYMYLDATRAMPEAEIIYVVHGNDKTWKRAYRWLKDECRHYRKKKVHVLELSEYQTWFKRFDEGKA